MLLADLLQRQCYYHLLKSYSLYIYYTYVDKNRISLLLHQAAHQILKTKLNFVHCSTRDLATTKICLMGVSLFSLKFLPSESPTSIEQKNR